MSCVEELIEALTFAHYLRTQSLMAYEESIQKVAELSTYVDQMDVDAAEDGSVNPQPTPPAPASLPPVHVTEHDYLMGIFDLSGEMMRFATIVAALNGTMAASGDAAAEEGERTIVQDMQDLGSFFAMLPQQYNKSYQLKSETLRQSVNKVEKLGYGLKVRGSERPAGWMPDNDDGPEPEN